MTEAEIKPETVARMVALVRRCASSKPICCDLATCREATAIVAELPKPIDPDLLIARESAMDMWQPGAWTDEQWEARILGGGEDDDRAVRAAFAAIKRVRAETANG